MMNVIKPTKKEEDQFKVYKCIWVIEGDTRV
jgi:hypothetical protein